MNIHIQQELSRLAKSPSSDEVPSGLGTVRFVVWCRNNADLVLEKAKAVLTIVDKASDNWPDENIWRAILPDWFLRKSAKEMTYEEAKIEIARLTSLSPMEQIEEEESGLWSLSNWLYYLEPGNRHWYWWDGKSLDFDVAVVAVQIDFSPFPWGALAWLLRAAGADKVEAEE